MKKLFTLLALVASISLASAQTSPKAESKKECKKGDKCCSKEKTASAETKTKEAKKN